LGKTAKHPSAILSLIPPNKPAILAGQTLDNGGILRTLGCVFHYADGQRGMCDNNGNEVDA